MPADVYMNGLEKNIVAAISVQSAFYLYRKNGGGHLQRIESRYR